MALQLTLIGVVTLIGVGIALWAFVFSKEEEKPVITPPPASKKIETKPKPKPTENLLKTFPPEIQKEITARCDEYSIRVDKLEHKLIDAEKLTDATERWQQMLEISDEFGACAEGIYNVIHDPKYDAYHAEEYGPSWAGPEQRLKFYTSKMNQMKKKADAAKNEVHGNEAAGEKGTASKPSDNK